MYTFFVNVNMFFLLTSQNALSQCCVRLDILKCTRLKCQTCRQTGAGGIEYPGLQGCLPAFFSILISPRRLSNFRGRQQKRKKEGKKNHFVLSNAYLFPLSQWNTELLNQSSELPFLCNYRCNTALTCGLLLPPHEKEGVRVRGGVGSHSEPNRDGIKFGQIAVKECLGCEHPNTQTHTAQLDVHFLLVVQVQNLRVFSLLMKPVHC